MRSSALHNVGYYDDNVEKYRQAKRTRTWLLRQHTTKVKEETPCADCEIQYPHYVMDFDHVRGSKTFNIASQLSNISSLARLVEEIEKCDVVCANCHRHRTWMRQTKESTAGVAGDRLAMYAIAMSEDLAWAAGFMDGEGTFGVQRQVGKKNILYVQAGQVDRRVLDKLHAALGGLGKVYGPYKPRRAGHSEYHYWRCMGAVKVRTVAELLWPWLSDMKREQYERVLIAEGQIHGSVAERTKALVLKTSGCDSPVGSNPTASS